MGDISVTAASVLASTTAQVLKLVAGATITAGQAVYIDTDDANKLKLADANGASTLIRTPVGISVSGASSGQPVLYCPLDLAGFTTGFGSVLAGDTIWLSATPGGMTKTAADLVQGMYVSVMGVMTTTAVMKLQPLTGGVVA